MRRFWKSAEAVREGSTWHVALDGKPMRVPGGAVLRVDSEPLAQAVAAEWQAASEQMSFDDAPLTRLAGTVQERILPQRTATIAALAAYAEADLLCYRAEQPAALVRRQAEAWQPWLDWAASRFAAPLHVGSGIQYVSQPPGSLRALHAAVTALPPFHLAALGLAVPAMGSLVLGLALAEGEITAPAAHDLAALDELFQVELWGEDPDAMKRRQRIASEIALAERFILIARA